MITAKIIADSITLDEGPRLTTFELEYPRFIHSEFMTHRMLSKNSASSRAIPVKAMHQHIIDHPQQPVEWGLNEPGMQASKVADPLLASGAKGVWDAARCAAISHSRVLSDMGLHKQIANRVTEPFMQMKVVCSGTEYANLFHLRKHKDADPTIRVLAEKMYEEYRDSTPTYLVPGEWHLPYIETKIHDDRVRYFVGSEKVSLEIARIVSASCCAQVSYRKNDDSIEKAKAIYDRLINSEPVHASPVEHQATPMDSVSMSFHPDTWEEGVTHVTANGDLWSGNFRGWIQHRQLIPNHVKW